MASYAASESDFLVKVVGIEGLWATRTGGDTPTDVSQVFNGGEDYATPVIGKKKPSNLVLTRPYDPRRDQQLSLELRRRQGSFRRTITQQPTLTDGTIVASPTTWIDCILINVKDPETNSGSSGAAMIELTFTPGRVA